MKQIWGSNQISITQQVFNVIFQKKIVKLKQIRVSNQIFGIASGHHMPTHAFKNNSKHLDKHSTPPLKAKIVKLKQIWGGIKIYYATII